MALSNSLTRFVFVHPMELFIRNLCKNIHERFDNYTYNFVSECVLCDHCRFIINKCGVVQFNLVLYIFKPQNVSVGLFPSRSVLLLLGEFLCGKK